MAVSTTSYQRLAFLIGHVTVLIGAVIYADAFIQPTQQQRRNQGHLQLNLQDEIRNNCMEVPDEHSGETKRRHFIKQSTSAVASFLMIPSTLPAFADETATADTQQQIAYTSPPNQKFRYTVTPPPSFTASNKPLKTHLDEINFSPPDVRGYTLGITVDPVRIKTIQEFGTPEEVAARVVTAEVNRDGVFRVTLAKDPKEDTEGCYDVEYISDGKRGTKRFVTRIYVKDGFLYVLTLQSKEAEYDSEREKEALECIKSFRPT